MLVVPMYEEEFSGLYYNTAAVIDADGKYLGKYRKHHLPASRSRAAQAAGSGKNTTSDRGIWATQFSKRRLQRLASTSATIATSPRARARSAWAAPRSSSIHRQPWPVSRNICGNSNSQRTPSPTAITWARSTASGWETPWNMGEFYGQAYLADPRGQIVAIGSRDKDEVVIGVMDRDLITEVRNTWQFFRDRRPETYDSLVKI